MSLISIQQAAKKLYDKEQLRYKNYLNQQFTTVRPREELYRTKYRSESEFRTAVDKYMIFL